MSIVPRAVFLVTAALLTGLPTSSRADLLGYWPLDDATGGTTANLASGGTAANVFGGVTAVFDAARNGNVFEFNGASGSYVDAGSIPVIGTNTSFTWGFWENSISNANLDAVVVGNRYNPSGGEFNPREFIKFTPSKFEFHRNAAGENFDYPDFAVGAWHYQTVVKDGNALVYMLDGVVSGVSRVTAGLNNPQPFYFGGNVGGENWNGRLDAVATWNNAVPLSSISRIAKGTATPLTAPATFTSQTVLSDNFDAPTVDSSKWNITNRGLENNNPSGYDAPVIVSGGVSGSNAVRLGGTTTTSYWYGSSLESKLALDGSKEALISVQRMSITATGTADRSSLWVLGDDGHYLHFSQNVGEGGWTFNARDDGGSGTLNPVGIGNNIGMLDALDGDTGQHKMGLRVAPTGDPGDYNILMYLDDQVVASQFVSNWPDTYHVILTGQARQGGDSVAAVFDELQVLQQVPEPGVAVLLMGGLALIRRRRRG